MLSLKFCYCIFFLCSGIGFCFATDTLTFNSSIHPEQQGQYIIVKEGLMPSSLSGKLSINIKIHPLVLRLLSNSCNSDQVTCSRQGKSKCIIVQTLNCNNTRLVMSLNGQLQFFRLQNMTKTWFLIWSGPDRCHACGSFSSCNNENRLFCKCLPGFKPKSLDNWNSEQFSDGCTRKSPICSKNSRINNFLRLSMIKVADSDSEFVVHNVSDCKKWCLDDCECQAYSYTESETYRRDLNFIGNATCSIWKKALNNISEDQIDGGHDIYLRLMHSEIEPTKRSCETCGTNMIPYPLSTGTSCGDPMYFSFYCETNNLTGQVYFNASGGGYRVTSINPESQKFSIDVKNAENCKSKEMMERFLQLDRSSPFYVRSGCNSNQRDFSTDSLFDSEWFEIDIGWTPPLEPLCNTSQDCSDWPNSSCLVAKDRKRRCLCYAGNATNASFQWDPTTVNCTSADYPNQNKRSHEEWKPLYLVIAGVIAATLIICFCFVYHKRKRRLVNRQDLEKRERESSKGNLALCLHDSEKRVKDFINSGQFGEDDKKDIDVPFLDLESIIAATDNFSDANKLGQGGFGPVYKGKYPGGQEIAIKRLSSGSGQGLEEFKNEVVLIAKLQHRNLVRLLGYCVEGQEKMLMYEYMPNKSLDSFIFDRTRCLLLTWEMRFDIILGIARGMLYLHQDSRLRIIHRDLKTSNVLLDEEMNPKISDFGLARIFGSRQTVASTTRVVGTYGYMSPEYALDGFFSFKSDVFSFGVVVLEIISGKRNTGFYQSEQALSLLGYTWRLWEEERALDLMDQTLRETCNTSEFLRCVNVGLLCVQEDPSDRPTMSNVVFMLGNEVATLPKPKQPAFVLRRSLSGATSSSKVEANSELMTTLEEGR
ncbi:hypothetical protein SLEP1_g31412 [Rubroshorea leprosula]|uniref:G-type lectin S-receptor-like serine/threonine-protein kinase At4g03230 n=1 Tax=Rubroshorea leprosula TaxID=152421 RepID=A0AAV5KAR9_9ROSI|nr:hypothetical protein SLEP1_g31412 [Rubroshorea leprosula]